MDKNEILGVCHLCGGELFIWVSSGNRPRELQDYSVDCRSCEMSEKFYAHHSRRQVARSYNRFVRELAVSGNED